MSTRSPARFAMAVALLTASSVLVWASPSYADSGATTTVNVVGSDIVITATPDGNVLVVQEAAGTFSVVEFAPIPIKSINPACVAVSAFQVDCDVPDLATVRVSL